MSDPLTFASASPRFGLPLLFTGQAQKEFYVNEAHSLTDALLHAVIEGEGDTPPAAPRNGDCWLVGSEANGQWAGHEGALACRQSDTWLFVIPRDGMTILDRSTGQVIRHMGDWKRPAAPAAPSGGSTVDQEARDAISGLIAALTAGGFFPSS